MHYVRSMTIPPTGVALALAASGVLMLVSGAINVASGETRALGFVLLVSGLVVVLSGIMLYGKARHPSP